jgi:hypothetical protein
MRITQPTLPYFEMYQPVGTATAILVSEESEEKNGEFEPRWARTGGGRDHQGKA